MSDGLPIREIFSSIQGEGYLAGRRQVFIRLTACNLDCRYCDTDFAARDWCGVERTPGSSEFERIPGTVELDRILETVREWTLALPGAHHSVSLTGGEPLLSARILADWLPPLRELLPVHLETNGTLAAELGRIVHLVDYISMDMKLPSTAGCGDELWDVHRRFLEAGAEKNISVKVVVDDATGEAEIRRVCALISAVRPNTPLFIQPLTHGDARCGIGAVHLLRLQALASSLLPDVRVIPQMHKLMGVM